jgi:hypothetical protein
MFWLILLLFIATTVIGELLAPKQQKPTAGALGDFNFPTAQEGRCIPYVIGECKIGGGNTVWWGDLRIAPITKRASIIAFSSTLIGYKYYIGVQYALCWGGPDLVLVGILANKKALPYTYVTQLNGNGSEDRLVLSVTGQYLFGGQAPGGEGGVAGVMDFYRGLLTQQPKEYLKQNKGRVTIDKSMGIGAEIGAFLAEELFESLDAPVLRVAAADCHVPHAPSLEEQIIPNPQIVADTLLRLAAY